MFADYQFFQERKMFRKTALLCSLSLLFTITSANADVMEEWRDPVSYYFEGVLDQSFQGMEVGMDVGTPFSGSTTVFYESSADGAIDFNFMIGGNRYFYDGYSRGGSMIEIEDNYNNTGVDRLYIEAFGYYGEIDEYGVGENVYAFELILTDFSGSIFDSSNRIYSISDMPTNLTLDNFDETEVTIWLSIIDEENIYDEEEYDGYRYVNSSGHLTYFSTTRRDPSNPGVDPGPSPTPTPEPASMLLMATGLAGLAALQRRRKNTAC